MSAILNLFVQPADTPMENIFGSDPGYNESYGPHVSYDFFGNEVAYVPVDEVAEEDSPLRFVVSGAESPEDREDRLYEAPEPTITVDPDYEPDLGPAKIACRHFSTEDFLSTTPGTRTVSIRTFRKVAKGEHSKNGKKREPLVWFNLESSVSVSVRKTRTLR